MDFTFFKIIQFNNLSMNKLYSLLLLSLLSYAGFAQTISEDRLLIPMISANIGYNHPGGDFDERFNGSGQVGAAFNLKFKSNIFIGIEGNYLFNSEAPYSEFYNYLENEDGWITNMYGEPGIVATKLAGFNAFVKAGYVANVFAPNPNSGLLFTSGVGLLQHQYWIEQRGNNMPQLADEYLPGYDRLCNGLMTNQFIGYLYFHKKAVWNFYLGLEFTQAFTKNRRDWDHIEQKKIDERRLDLLYSIKLGWTISFHKRMATELYYY